MWVFGYNLRVWTLKWWNISRCKEYRLVEIVLHGVAAIVLALNRVSSKERAQHFFLGHSSADPPGRANFLLDSFTQTRHTHWNSFLSATEEEIPRFCVCVCVCVFHFIHYRKFKYYFFSFFIPVSIITEERKIGKTEVWASLQLIFFFFFWRGHLRFLSWPVSRVAPAH